LLYLLTHLERTFTAVQQSRQTPLKGFLTKVYFILKTTNHVLQTIFIRLKIEKYYAEKPRREKFLLLSLKRFSPQDKNVKDLQIIAILRFSDILSRVLLEWRVKNLHRSTHRHSCFFVSFCSLAGSTVPFLPKAFKQAMSNAKSEIFSIKVNKRENK